MIGSETSKMRQQALLFICAVFWGTLSLGWISTTHGSPITGIEYELYGQWDVPSLTTRSVVSLYAGGVCDAGGMVVNSRMKLDSTGSVNQDGVYIQPVQSNDIKTFSGAATASALARLQSATISLATNTIQLAEIVSSGLAATARISDSVDKLATATWDYQTQNNPHSTAVRKNRYLHNLIGRRIGADNSSLFTSTTVQPVQKDMSWRTERWVVFESTVLRTNLSTANCCGSNPTSGVYYANLTRTCELDLVPPGPQTLFPMVGCLDYVTVHSVKLSYGCQNVFFDPAVTASGGTIADISINGAAGDGTFLGVDYMVAMGGAELDEAVLTLSSFESFFSIFDSQVTSTAQDGTTYHPTSVIVMINPPSYPGLSVITRSVTLAWMSGQYGCAPSITSSGMCSGTWGYASFMCLTSSGSTPTLRSFMITKDYVIMTRQALLFVLQTYYFATDRPTFPQYNPNWNDLILPDRSQGFLGGLLPTRSVPICDPVVSGGVIYHGNELSVVKLYRLYREPIALLNGTLFLLARQPPEFIATVGGRRVMASAALPGGALRGWVCPTGRPPCLVDRSLVIEDRLSVQELQEQCRADPDCNRGYITEGVGYGASLSVSADYVQTVQLQNATSPCDQCTKYACLGSQFTCVRQNGGRMTCESGCNLTLCANIMYDETYPCRINATFQVAKTIYVSQNVTISYDNSATEAEIAAQARKEAEDVRALAEKTDGLVANMSKLLDVLNDFSNYEYYFPDNPGCTSNFFSFVSCIASGAADGISDAGRTAAGWVDGGFSWAGPFSGLFAGIVRFFTPLFVIVVALWVGYVVVSAIVRRLAAKAEWASGRSKLQTEAVKPQLSPSESTGGQHPPQWPSHQRKPTGKDYEGDIFGQDRVATPSGWISCIYCCLQSCRCCPFARRHARLVLSDTESAWMAVYSDSIAMSPAAFSASIIAKENKNRVAVEGLEKGKDRAVADEAGRCLRLTSREFAAACSGGSHPGVVTLNDFRDACNQYNFTQPAVITYSLCRLVTGRNLAAGPRGLIPAPLLQGRTDSTTRAPSNVPGKAGGKAGMIAASSPTLPPRPLSGSLDNYQGNPLALCEGIEMQQLPAADHGQGTAAVNQVLKPTTSISPSTGEIPQGAGTQAIGSNGPMVDDAVFKLLDDVGTLRLSVASK